VSGATIVTNMEDRHASDPPTLEQRGDALEHLGGVVRLRVAREHPLLDVDDDERGRHASVSCATAVAAEWFGEPAEEPSAHHIIPHFR
jgi:hypothetical protein